MNFKKLIIISMTLLLGVSTAHADLNSKMDQMCGKIKECAFEDMGDLTPEMKQMMAGMVEGLCMPLLTPYQKVLGDAGLEKKGEACIDSFVNMSCAEIKQHQGDSAPTKECQDLEKAAEKAGVDLGQK